MKDQKGGSCISGTDLLMNLADIPVYGVQLLDFYIRNPHFIPGEFKNEYIFFWGHIYMNRQGQLCVRYLFWRNPSWGWGSQVIGSTSFESFHPAAIQGS